MRQAMNELMDRSPSGDHIKKVRELAASVPGVEDVEKCLVRKMGYFLFVDMHLEVNPEMTVKDSHDLAHQVKQRIKEALPIVKDVLVHVEPAGQKREPPARGA
jgi:divalent metal cation (Fe/Co/Zn/Cd) transporter